MCVHVRMNLVPYKWINASIQSGIIPKIVWIQHCIFQSSLPPEMKRKKIDNNRDRRTKGSIIVDVAYTHLSVVFVCLFSSTSFISAFIFVYFSFSCYNTANMTTGLTGFFLLVRLMLSLLFSLLILFTLSMCVFVCVGLCVCLFVIFVRKYFLFSFNSIVIFRFGVYKICMCQCVCISVLKFSLALNVNNYNCSLNFGKIRHIC